MKKSVLLLAAAFGVTGAFAQDLADKKGRLILPEAGDWGLSVDASPFVNFAADLVHIGAAQTAAGASPNFNGLNGTHPTYSIAGKYFANANTAYRGIVRLYNDNNSTVKYINTLNTGTPTAQTWPNTLNPDQVKDIHKSRDWAYGIGGGIEKRKGTKYRLQGYYGAEASIILAGGNDKYKYGNDVVANSVTTSAADDNVGAYTTNFGTNLSLNAADHDERTLAVKNGKTVAFAVRGFAGVEYFFASKMSIGGEFGWGFGMYRTGRSTKTVEGVDWIDDAGASIASGAGSVVGKTKEKTGDVTKGFFLGHDRNNTAAPTQYWMNSYSPSGTLSLNFYF